MTLEVVLGALVVLATAGVFGINVLDGFWGEAFGFGFLTAVVGVAVAIPVLMLGVLTLSPLVGYDTLTRTEHLVALTDERNAFGGAFFLGTGVVGSSPSYTFYSAEADGSRQLHQYDAEGISVFEDTSDPYVIWTDGCRSHHPALVHCWPEHMRLLSIHVPAGSIRTGIKLGVDGSKS